MYNCNGKCNLSLYSLILVAQDLSVNMNAGIMVGQNSGKYEAKVQKIELNDIHLDHSSPKKIKHNFPSKYKAEYLGTSSLPQSNNST